MSSENVDLVFDFDAFGLMVSFVDKRVVAAKSTTRELLLHPKEISHIFVLSFMNIFMSPNFALLCITITFIHTFIICDFFVFFYCIVIICNTFSLAANISISLVYEPLSPKLSVSEILTKFCKRRDKK